MLFFLKNQISIYYKLLGCLEVTTLKYVTYPNKELVF